MSTCLNCGARTSERFCSACGQKTSTQRISWHWLMHEVLGSVLVVDRGLFFTLKELFTRPGLAIREFLEGKRQVHFKPLGTLVLAATIYSLLTRWIKPDLGPLMTAPEQVAVIETFNHWMGNYYALMELALIPLFAFCSWIVMRKYGHNLVEHMVIQSYLAAQRITLSIPFIALNLLGYKVAMLGSMLLSMGYLAGYMIGFVQIYDKRSPVRVLSRALVALFISFVMLSIFAVAGVILLTKLGILPGLLSPVTGN